MTVVGPKLSALQAVHSPPPLLPDDEAAAAALLRSYSNWLLLSLDGHLDEVSKGLRLLESIGRKAREAADTRVADGCMSVFEKVQMGIVSNFGFKLSWSH